MELVLDQDQQYFGKFLVTFYPCEDQLFENPVQPQKGQTAVSLVKLNIKYGNYEINVNVVEATPSFMT